MSRMSHVLGVFLAFSPLAALGGSADLQRVEPTTGKPAPDVVLAATFDFCLKDSTNGSVLRFNSTTGAYVVCGENGTFFEQGTGIVSTSGNTVRLSHTFGSWLQGNRQSVGATVNTATGQGQATVLGSNETGNLTRITISDPNVNDGDCSACNAQSAIREGVINSVVNETNSIGLGNSVTDVTFLQKFAFNPDFTGRLTTLTAAIGRNGAGSLAFQFAAYRDDNGKPGELTYLGPELHFATFPALPAIGIVHVNVDIPAAADVWVGVHWHPNTDPLYLPFSAEPDVTLSDVYFCEPGHACNDVTTVEQFKDLRGLYLSSDYEYPGLYASGGLVRYGDGNSTDIVSYKCGGAYLQVDLSAAGIRQLYSENFNDSRYPNTSFSHAFARINSVGPPGTGLDGIATTTYGTARFAAFSYIASSQLKFCTKPDDATDFLCHDVAGFHSGDCDYTRIAGIQAGFEISCANAPKDWIDRWQLKFDGSGWQQKAMNPVKATPSIGSPEFGFPWYAAQSTKLGIAYEYKTTAGLIQTQLVKDNTVVGTYTIDTDTPPPSFNPSFSSRMAGDCTRSGLCVFGRYDSKIASNVADMIDFRESPPDIKSWVLGPSPAGFGFGRAVSIAGRDEKALYSAFSTSSVSNQYKLQLDYVDLKAYQKFSLSFDYAVGAGNYPLALGREDAEWGLGHAKGVDSFYSLTGGCEPARVSGREPSGTPDQGTRIPCQNVLPVGLRF